MMKTQKNKNLPPLGVINLSDIQGDIPNRQKLKKKKTSEDGEKKPALDISKMPAPHKIKRTA